MAYTRRTILGGALAGASTLMLPSFLRAQAGAAEVVVVGGGFGGATAARYLRHYAPQVRVTLVEPAQRFYTCPFSNLYLAGLRTWDSIGHDYDGLRAAGVTVVHARADSVDTAARTVRLSSGQTLRWDRLVLSPGVDMRWGALEGYDEAASARAPHAWKAGEQTLLLRRQLEAMPNGGRFVMTIPENPFRCPPGPYERAAMVAHYFKQHKPRSKILLLDAKESFSKQGLFQQGWKALYGDMIEWVKQSDDGHVMRVDAAKLEVETAFGERHQADVLNVIPSMRAGDIAVKSGLATANKRWCEVDFLTFESIAVKNVHVLGDSIQTAPGMPKSGHMANQHGKVCAAAVVSLLQGKEVPGLPIYANTCYSFVAVEETVHVASVHRYDAAKKTMLPVTGAGGLSTAPSELESRYALAWARNIWADTLA